MSYLCPVCGYDDFEEPPWEGLAASLEICPSCGIQFGYDDFAGGDAGRRFDLHDQWRRRWIDGGMRWWSPSLERRPAGWDPQEQLRRLSLNLHDP